MESAFNKKLFKECKSLTDFVKDYLVLLDHEMRQPSSPKRGERIAELSNKLQMKNDMVRRFTLDFGFNGKPMKRPRAVNHP